MQKSKIEAELYNSNKNCDRKIRKSSKATLDFIVPIKLTATTGVGGEGKSERIFSTSQNIRIVYVYFESLMSESLPRWKSQFSPH